MRNTAIILTPAILLSFFGAYISFQLVSKHVPHAEGPGWFDAVCESATDAGVDCASVLNSRWGFFPPKDTEGKPRSFSKPVALMGLWYYSALSAWYLFVGRPSYAKRFYHLLPLLWNVAGVLFSAYFLYVLFFKLDSRCNWCLVSHGANAVLMIFTILLWPRRPFVATPSVVMAQEISVAEPAAVAWSASLSGITYPSGRLVVSTMALSGALMFAELHMLNTALLNYQVVEYRKFQANLNKDIGLLVAMHESQPKHDIPIRPDDPVRGSGKDMMEVVIFSDFECSHCKEFAEQLDEKLLPMFDNKLKVIFKHFPACIDCNPRVPRTVHRHACETAQAAEAARMQGGSEAFWKLHDKLFAENERLGHFDYRAAASELGMAPEHFMEDMKSSAVADRIKEDAELGQTLGVTATPAVFVSGRQVGSAARGSTVFWQTLKNAYDRSMAQRGATTQKSTTTQPTEP